MARTRLGIISVSRFALTSSTGSFVPVAADVTNGNVAANDGFTLLEMTLAGGVARDVMLAIPSGFDQDLVISDRTYTLPSNGVYLAGVYPVSAYGSELLLDVSGAGVSFRLLSMRGAV